jgi:branched-chain amino acid transport system permease protein
MPAAAIFRCGRLVMSWPRNVTLPAVGRCAPVMMLNIVLLPAPFGPIRATISPALTSKLTALTLKAFVAAIIGGLGSYPLTAVGAVAVGVLESFAAFWSSALKESIVFSTLIPVLLWRSLLGPQHEEEEEEIA